MIQIQITLEVEGNHADAVKAVEHGLYSGVFQNSICEHDIEGLAPLSLVDIKVCSRGSLDAPFVELPLPVDEPLAQPAPAPTPPSEWPENCIVLDDPSPTHVTRQGRKMLEELRIKRWDPKPQFQTGDLVIVQGEVLEVVEADEAEIRNYVLQEPKRILSAPESIMRLVVRGDGKLSPRRF